MAGDRHESLAGESPFQGPPKEQPPRNLSGKRTARDNGTLESVAREAATEGVSGRHPRKLSGPVTEGVRFIGGCDRRDPFGVRP